MPKDPNKAANLFLDLKPFIDKEAREIAEAVYKQKAQQFGVAKVPFHIHNGIDSPNVPWGNISQRQLAIHWTIPGIQAATATNYGVFWTAPFNCTVVGFTEVHQTAGTNGGAVTLQLERLQGTEAPDGGDELLATALSLKATANTVQTGTFIGNINTKQLLEGNRLCLKDAGTLTDVANVTVVVVVQY